MGWAVMCWASACLQQVIAGAPILNDDSETRSWIPLCCLENYLLKSLIICAEKLKPREESEMTVSDYVGIVMWLYRHCHAICEESDVSP